MSLEPEQVEWIVNDNAELGVKIGDQFFFCYKGRSLVYADETHDDGRPMWWRPIGKREFGECIHPVNYQNPMQYGTVNLNDSSEWQRLDLPPLTEDTKPAGNAFTLTDEPAVVNLIHERGKRIERLGRMMQDPGTTITELSVASYSAGLTLQFRVVSTEGVP